MSEPVTLSLVGAGGALGGAAIGAIAAYFTTRVQLSKAKELDLDRRLFDARREAYERAVTVFSFTHNERMNNRRYPQHSTDSEAQWKAHEMMGPVMLWSKGELANKVREFSGYLAKPIPMNFDERLQDTKKGNKLWIETILLMRKEVGMEDFMKDDIGELPQTPTK